MRFRANPTAPTTTTCVGWETSRTCSQTMTWGRTNMLALEKYEPLDRLNGERKSKAE